MTVVGLHPEELFDKLLEGELTRPERERLLAHLNACEVCRFEYVARLDFRAEALERSASGPPPVPLRPLFTEAEAPSLARGAVVPARRRRSRFAVWGLAAAALISASGAVASSVIGKAPWYGVTSMFSPRATPAAQLVAALPKKAKSTPAVVPAVEIAAPTPAAAAPALPTLSPALVRHGRPARGHVVKDNGVKQPLVEEPTSAAKLFGEANRARRSGDMGRASGLYRLLQAQAPGSAEAELSRVTLALLLLDNGDAQAALIGFERYLAGSSLGLEAEALVGRARALGRLGRRDLEALAWQEVRRKYASSIYGRQASERLSALGQP